MLFESIPADQWEESIAGYRMGCSDAEGRWAALGRALAPDFTSPLSGPQMLTLVDHFADRYQWTIA